MITPFSLLFPLLLAQGLDDSGAPPAITKLPAVVHEVKADYPAAALEDRIEARVELEIDITEKGTVEDIQLLKTVQKPEVRRPEMTWPEPKRPSPLPDYGFGAAAIHALRDMQFSPAEAGGNPIRVRISYSYDFVLPPPRLPEPSPLPKPETRTPEAQQGVIRFHGQIVERGSRKLLPGVLVTVFRGEGAELEGYEATTDANGVFAFYDLADGPWKLQADLPGYFPLRSLETLNPKEALSVKYYLERGSYSEYDVEVRAERVRKEVTRRSLSRAEVLKVPGALGDPIRVLTNLPGVARGDAGGLAVRGTSPRDTQVYVDGIGIPLAFHFGGLRSVVPAEVIEQVDLFPGNYGLRYGRYLGGVIDIQSRELKPDQFHGALDISLLDTSIFLQGPITDTISIAAGVRRSYIDILIEKVMPKDADVGFLNAPRYYDYQVLSQWRPNSRHRLQLNFIGSDDIIRLLFKNPASADVQTRGNNFNAAQNFWRVWSNYQFTPSERFQNRLTVGVGVDTAKLEIFNLFKFDLDYTTFQVRELAELQITPWFKLGAGLDLYFQYYDIEVMTSGQSREGETNPSRDQDRKTYANLKSVVDPLVAPFVETEFKFFDDRLVLQPGIRVDYEHAIRAWSFDPRITARFKLSDAWLFKGGVGRVSGLPKPEDTNESFGNPEVSWAHSLQSSVGAEYQPLPFLRFDAVLFYQDLSDLAVRSSRTVERNGRRVPLNVEAIGIGHVYGFELFIEHKFHNNFRGWLSYTLSRSERRDRPGARMRLFDYDQTHILNLLIAYALPSNWEVGFRWRLVSGNLYTPYTSRGGTFEADLDRYTPSVGRANSARLPLFHQLDLRLDKRWIFDDFTVNAYFSLMNLYNNPGVEGYTYDYDLSQRKPLRGLPVLPIVGLKGEW